MVAEVVVNLNEQKGIGSLMVQIDGDVLYTVQVLSSSEAKRKTCVRTIGAPPHTREKFISPEEATRRFEAYGVDTKPLIDYLIQEGWAP